MSGYGNTEQNVETSGGTTEKTIDWKDYNWPPLLRVAHMKPFELSGIKRTVVLMSYTAYLAMLPILVFNFAITFIIACASFGCIGDSNCPLEAWAWLISSLLNFVICLIIGGGVFWIGYKGLAANKRSFVWIWFVGWFFVTLYQFLMGLIYGLNYNGLFNLIRITGSVGQALPGGMPDFWIAMCVIESLAWLLLAVFSIVTYISMIQAFREVKGKSFQQAAAQAAATSTIGTVKNKFGL